MPSPSPCLLASSLVGLARVLVNEGPPEGRDRFNLVDLYGNLVEVRLDRLTDSGRFDVQERLARLEQRLEEQPKQDRGRVPLQVKEVASRLGCSDKWVYENWERVGLCGFRAGRLVRIWSDSVTEFLARQAAEPEPVPEKTQRPAPPPRGRPRSSALIPPSGFRFLRSRRNVGRDDLA
jgi:excisionase family DNA binding protein